MIKDVHILMVNVVASEKFPEKGWFGFVKQEEEGIIFYGVFSRASLYKEVKKLICAYGVTFKMIAERVSVPKGAKTIFVPYANAKTPEEAERIIRDTMLSP